MAEMKITLFAAYSRLLSVGRVTLPTVKRWSHTRLVAWLNLL